MKHIPKLILLACSVFTIAAGCQVFESEFVELSDSEIEQIARECEKQGMSITPHISKDNQIYKVTCSPYPQLSVTNYSVTL